MKEFGCSCVVLDARALHRTQGTRCVTPIAPVAFLHYGGGRRSQELPLLPQQWLLWLLGLYFTGNTQAHARASINQEMNFGRFLELKLELKRGVLKKQP